MIRKPNYKISYTNFEGNPIVIQITDMEDYDPFLTEFYDVNLQGSETPLKMTSALNSDNSLYGIFTTTATIQFEATDEIGMHTFVEGPMNKWRVLIQGPGFQGYLLADGMEEPFMRQRTVTLTAVQNLGLLKDIELTDNNGARLEGKYSLAQLVCYCLYKTGIDYPLHVADNLFEKDQEDRSVRWYNSPYDQTYVDVLTFEKDINELEDCYTVLEKILISRKSRLFIQDGAWWIVRVDEYINPTLIYSRFAISTGEISTAGEEALSVVKSIGNHKKGFDIFPINEDALVFAAAQNKEVRLNWDYQFPKEKIKNIDYTRGDFSSPLSGFGYSAYNLDDWDELAGYGTDGVQSTNFNAYIKRTFDDLGYETERVILLTKSVTANSTDHIKSQPVPICETDKFTFGFDYAATSNPSRTNNTTMKIAAIILEGDDGTQWVLGDNTEPTWKLSNANYTVNADFYDWVFAKGDDLTEWQSFSIESAPVPVSGDLYIMFFTGNQQSTSQDDFDIKISNISFNYYPLINGQYKEFTGESYRVSQDGNYPKKIDEQIYLADAPCDLFKGAMFKYIFPEGNSYTGLNITGSNDGIAVVGAGVEDYEAGQKIKLTGTTLNDKIFTIDNIITLSSSHIEIYTVEELETEVILGSVEISIGYLGLTEGWNDKTITIPDEMEDERAVKWFLYDVFQQGRSTSRLLDFTLQGLDSGDDPCGPLNKYNIDIISPHTNNRFFLLLRYDQDWHLCEWTASFVEGFYTVNERSYGYNFEHKYLER